MTSKQLILTGARHALPIVLGYVPVGIAYAVYALQSGFSEFELLLLSFTGYSGSGQFLTVDMTAKHAGVLAIAVGVFLLNFRYFIMSACVFNRFKKLSLIKRLLMCHLITDETFAIFTTAEVALVSEAYFIGLFVTSYIAWISGAVLGIAASAFLPPYVTAALGIALYALFIAIIMPGCKRDLKIFAMVVFTALLNCALILLAHFDTCWAVVISTLTGAILGAFFIKDTHKGEDGNAEKGKEGNGTSSAPEPQKEEGGASA